MPPKKKPAHPGLESVDPFGAMVVVVSTIISLAWFLHDTPIQHIVAAVLGFYGVLALVAAMACRKGKVSQS